MDYLFSVIFFFLLSAIMMSVGTKLCNLTRLNFFSKTEKCVFSFSLGFGLVSYLVLLLGAAHVLYRSVFVVSLVLITSFLIPEVKVSLKDICSIFKASLLRKESIFTIPIILILLLASLAPSFSNDSMVYHLTDAKYFAKNHYVGFIPNNSVNALWPYLVEMYFTLALMFNLSPAAGLVQFALFLASCAAIYAFGKRFFSPKVAVLSVLVFMLVPGVHIVTMQTYVDMGMVFYFFMAFYAFFIWRQTKSSRWFLLSGFLSGLALSVKYFALILPVLIILFFATEVIEGKFKSVKSYLYLGLLFSLAVLVSSFFWYLRQYAILGNPLFPFFQKIFGNSGFNPAAMAALSEEGIRGVYGVRVSLINFLKLPWTVTMFPLKFGGEQLGPLFLIVIPGIILIKNKNSNVKMIMLFVLLYLSGWFLQYQNLRFIFPVVPLLSVISGYVLCGLIDKGFFSKKTLSVFMGIYAFFIVGLLIYYAKPAIRVVAGFESKDNYLDHNERSYKISQYLNSHLSLDSKILVANEGHTFFVDLNNEREIYHWIYGAYDKKLTSAQEVVSYFKEKGFTHILLADFPEQGASKEGKLRITRLLRDDRFREKYLEFVKELIPDSSNANGVRYILFKIKV